MKNIYLVGAILLLTIACDPSSLMDAHIENTTTQNLTITFVSKEFTELNKSLTIDSNDRALYQEGFSTTGSFLEVSLEGIDSVYISNTLGDVLKIYTPATSGRNIYNIDEYWMASQPSKRFYQYDYQITDQDIGP